MKMTYSEKNFESFLAFFNSVGFLIQWAISLFLFFASLFHPAEVAAQAGRYAGAYLQTGAGVRPLGLGGAFVAAANDVTAGYWNPAGLSQIAEPQFIGMYSLLSLDRRYNYAAAAYPFGSAGTVSLSWIHYGVGNITARDQTGAVTGEFSNRENAILISYGKSLPENFAIGGSLKLLRHDLANRSAAGVGFDLGVFFKPREILALGASVQNLQTQIRWDGAKKTKEIFPRLERVGAQIKPLSFANLCVDYEIVEEKKGKLHFGGEFYFGNNISLRTGSDGGAMTWGASFLVSESRRIIAVDYALTRDPISQSLAHKFALLLKFSKPSSPPVTNGSIISDKSPPPLDENAIASASPESTSIPQNPIRFIVQVIEVRPPYIIISSPDLAGLQSSMALKVYQSQLGKETGRYYGLGEALDVSPRYAIIKMNTDRSIAALAVGDKLMMKAVPE